MISSSKTILFSILIPLFWLYSYESPFAQITNPDGELSEASADDIWAKTLEGRHFNEFWNYQIYLNNDMKVHIIFSAANFGRLKSPVTGVRVSVLNLNGDLYQLSREYPIDRLVQDRENYMFRLHPERDIYFKGKLPEEHSIYINTSKDGVHYNIRLNFDQISSGYKWAPGEFRIGRETIGMITHIPYAKVSGYVEVDGTRKDVVGTGYMDHTFQDQMTTRMMHSGYRFVKHDGPDNWDLLYFMLPDKSSNRQTVGYRLTNTNGSVDINGVNRIESLTNSSAFGRTVPQKMLLRLDNSHTVEINRIEDEESFSVLGELGSLARRAARTILGGEVIDFRGEAELSETGNESKKLEYNIFMVK